MSLVRRTDQVPRSEVCSIESVFNGVSVVLVLVLGPGFCPLVLFKKNFMSKQPLEPASRKLISPPLPAS